MPSAASCLAVCDHCSLPPRFSGRNERDERRRTPRCEMSVSPPFSSSYAVFSLSSALRTGERALPKLLVFAPGPARYAHAIYSRTARVSSPRTQHTHCGRAAASLPLSPSPSPTPVTSGEPDISHLPIANAPAACTTSEAFGTWLVLTTTNMHSHVRLALRASILPTCRVSRSPQSPQGCTRTPRRRINVRDHRSSFLPGGGRGWCRVPIGARGGFTVPAHGGFAVALPVRVAQVRLCIQVGPRA
ncbi:hypothetical protein C2E23DRAFT_626423 [Lenzites betulinus]|nr:hypothetical protein C2E23DRAFT_626423 [Lenzites betulinus]